MSWTAVTPAGAGHLCIACSLPVTRSSNGGGRRSRWGGAPPFSWATSCCRGPTGKPASDDVREGKRTVLLAIARARATAAQARIIDERLGDPRLDGAGAAEVRAVITDTGALAACEVMIGQRVAEAVAALQQA